MKIKKLKPSTPSVLHKAVSNVTKIVKRKEKTASKKNIFEGDSTTLKRLQDSIKNAARKSFVDKEKKPFRSTRGIVYIGHIPHGFYETEMKEYFKQFGLVTRVRVARSRNTGRSRGYAYVEFKNEDVAKIAAETMNNYLMCGRLLKSTYIPPEKQHRGFFLGKSWTAKIYPRVANRIKELRKNNSDISVSKHKENCKKKLKKLAALEETLKNAGVNIKFKPRNVPK